MNNKIEYPKKKVNGKTVILCQNSNEDSTWFKGKICSNWVLINEDSIAALCSNCVNETLQ